jgi:hypothetical protein
MREKTLFDTVSSSETMHGFPCVYYRQDFVVKPTANYQQCMAWKPVQVSANDNQAGPQGSCACSSQQDGSKTRREPRKMLLPVHVHKRWSEYTSARTKDKEVTIDTTHA